jgi:hypothetical protein
MDLKERRAEGRRVESAEECRVSRDFQAFVGDFTFTGIHEKKVRALAVSKMVGGR